MQQKRVTTLLIIVFGIIIGIVAVLSLLLSGTADKFRVEILTVPSDATLTIDGKSSKTGKVSLSKGEHTLAATRQYFKDATKVINTANLEPDEKIYLILGRDSPEADQYMLDHQDEQDLYEAAIGAEFSATQTSLTDRYPVVSSLPYKTLDYKINYSVDEAKNVSFNVELYPVATVPGTPEYKQQLVGFKEEALKYLKDHDLDTQTAVISYSPDPDAL